MPASEAQIVRVRFPPHGGEVGVHSQLLNGTLDGARRRGLELHNDGQSLGCVEANSLRALDRSYFLRLQVRQDRCRNDVLVQPDLRQRSSWIWIPDNIM